MMTSGICERFGFARPRRRKHGSASITSGWKMACALLVLCAATAITSPAQTFRILVNFNGTNGGTPSGPPVQGLDGNFYGTTDGGGAYGGGTVFKITRRGALTTLYSFCTNWIDCPGAAAFPGRLVQGTDGNFYGTAGGGAYGRGTIFKITPAGTLTTLYSFCAQKTCADGSSPNGVIQGTDGNFYGTTEYGGAYGHGTVFKITPNGVLTTLHSFCSQTGCPDGGGPGGLIQATDGNFYGIAGTFFKITPGGTLTTLAGFSGDYGSDPPAVVQAADGNFYGSTAIGGAGCIVGPPWREVGCGTVFKITPGGTWTTLYEFCPAPDPPSCPDGINPAGGLVQGTDGNFYGTTMGGGTLFEGAYGEGTIFKITLAGTLTTLYSGPDGWNPLSGLMQATDGTFYGTTGGTIFSLCAGLGWFTEELPNYGKVGATIDILGTKLTGASYVTFNGIAAAFTIVSPTLIQATVPPGATTGYVRVMLPSGRIPSNKKFRVTPQITSFTPASGPAGTLVTITGVSLTQTWEVTIRGVHASFTVVDDGTVTATVPTGATTGTIRVTGPGGAATSTANFTVD